MSPAGSLSQRRSTRDRMLLTPEGIALPVTVASRGARAGALIIDFMIIFFLQLASLFLMAWLVGGVFEAAIEGGEAGPAVEFLSVVWILIMFLFRNAYFLFFELGPRGATPGKRLTGIRIAARNGGRLSVEMVVARNLLRDIELFLPFVYLLVTLVSEDAGITGLAITVWLLIFVLFPFFNKDRLRAGDIVAGSWVLETPRRKLEQAMSVEGGMRAEPGEAASHGYRFADAELAVYGEYELQTLERVLREDREEAMVAVMEAICLKIGREADYRDPRAFLDAYYTQLRALLEANMRMGQRKADKFA